MIVQSDARKVAHASFQSTSIWCTDSKYVKFTTQHLQICDSHCGQIIYKVIKYFLRNTTFFFKENVRNPVWICRDPISL